MVSEGEIRRRRRRGWTHHSRLRKKFVARRYAEMAEKQDIVCCPLCGMPLWIEEATIDHIVPLSKGGSNDESNLQLAHRKCNWDKGNLV